jgi:hypothetical protein
MMRVNAIRPNTGGHKVRTLHKARFVGADLYVGPLKMSARQLERVTYEIH